jgi:hypothetical protein
MYAVVVVGVTAMVPLGNVTAPIPLLILALVAVASQV